MTGLRTAVTFLTRVPVGDGRGADIAAAPAWFAPVGAAIGAVCGLVFVGTWRVLPPGVAAAVAVAAGVLITGAFHHDGLADMADAFGGGWNPEQRLEILKDSRHGTYGVMALILVVAVQIGALTSLGPAQGFAALVAAHALGRAGAVGLLLVVAPAAGQGLGADHARVLRRGRAVAGVLVGAGAAAAVLGPWSAAMAGAAGLAVVLVGVLANRKIGGIVGDVLGAAEQVAETAVLVVASAITHAHHLWPWWT